MELKRLLFVLSASTILCAGMAHAEIKRSPSIVDNIAPIKKSPSIVDQPAAAPAPQPAPAVVAAPVAPQPAVPAGPVLGLSDTISRALQTHPQIKAGVEAQRQADAAIKEQRAGFFPVIGIDSQMGHEHNDDLDTRALTPNNGAGDSWYGNGTVTLTQPLFSGLGTVNRLEGAKDREAAAGHDLDGTAEDVALRAARAHLNLMRTRELLGMSGQFITDIESRQKSIALSVKEGASDEAEALQAQEIGAAARSTRLGYDEAYRQAEADYIEISGAGPEGNLGLGTDNWDQLVPATLDGALAQAFQDSPRLLAADKMMHAYGSEASAEKSVLAPRLDAVASYMKQDQKDDVGGESTSTRAMLRLGWNLSTGGAELARIDQAKHQQSEALAKREGVMRAVESAVRQKYAAMQIADQQYDLLSQREDASQKILKNFLAQFEGGKQTNLQIIAAQSRLFESQAARTDAYYRKVLARLELLNAMGRLRAAFEMPTVAAGAAGDQG